MVNDRNSIIHPDTWNIGPNKPKSIPITAQIHPNPQSPKPEYDSSKP